MLEPRGVRFLESHLSPSIMAQNHRVGTHLSQEPIRSQEGAPESSFPTLVGTPTLFCTLRLEPSVPSQATNVLTQALWEHVRSALGGADRVGKFPSPGVGGVTEPIGAEHQRVPAGGSHWPCGSLHNALGGRLVPAHQHLIPQEGRSSHWSPGASSMEPCLENLNPSWLDCAMLCWQTKKPTGHHRLHPHSSLLGFLPWFPTQLPSPWQGHRALREALG